jgi:hypothetical protein
MIETLQRPLPLYIHQRTALVTVETARCALGVDTDSILAMLDDGTLRWAWNISAGSQLREIRIWARDVITYQTGLGPERLHSSTEVIDSVIGTQRDRLSSVEISTHILICSRDLAGDLVRLGQLRGDLVGHTQWITRDSLVQFLTRRLL